MKLFTANGYINGDIEMNLSEVPTKHRDSTYPFMVMGVGEKWYIIKPNGERINVYFNTCATAFKVAKVFQEVYYND